MEKLRGGSVGEYLRKLFACYYGFAGEGKTTQLLTFPPPLHILNCGDRDIKPLLEQLPESHDIYYEWLVPDVDALSQRVAEGYLQRADALLALALKNGGSFLMDGIDIHWEFVQIAKITAPEGTALRYKPANQYCFDFFGKLTSSPLQIGVTSLAAEIWNGPSSTGRFRYAGWKHIDRYIETAVRMFIKEQMAAGEKPQATQNPTVTHAAYIEQSKKAEHLARRVFDNMNFGFLYKATFGVPYPEEDKLWKPS